MSDDNVIGIDGKPVETNEDTLLYADIITPDEDRMITAYYGEIYSEMEREYFFESINDLCVDLGERDYDFYNADKQSEGRLLAVAVLDAIAAAGKARIDLGTEMLNILDEDRVGLNE